MEASADDTTPDHIVVTGLMGVGKSTLADRLGTLWRRPVRDSDRDIEAVFGRNGAAIAEEHGVAELHRVEAAVLIGALASPIPLVIAAAASVVEDERCREALACRARTVVLTAPTDALVERSSSGGHRRPVSADEFEMLRRRRSDWFRELAAVMVDATLPIDDVVERAQRALGASTN